jgi:hypothetical protein
VEVFKGADAFEGVEGVEAFEGARSIRGCRGIRGVRGSLSQNRDLGFGVKALIAPLGKLCLRDFPLPVIASLRAILRSNLLSTVAVLWLPPYRWQRNDLKWK